MKKLLLCLFLFSCAAGYAGAQEIPEKPEKPRPHRKYVNFGFSMPELRIPDLPVVKSNYGASFTVGRTYFMHRRPIAGMLRFGLDATWLDINYANYTFEFHEEEYEPESMNLHQAELAMQVGPSISINPVGKLNIHTYFRYAPTFSGLYGGNEFLSNYATVFVGGGAVSYGKIGLGVEARFGDCRYKNLFGGGEEESDGEASGGVQKTAFSGLRVYLSIRF